MMSDAEASHRRQLGAKPRRMDSATRIALALLSQLFDWRDSLVVVAALLEDCEFANHLVTRRMRAVFC